MGHYPDEIFMVGMTLNLDREGWTIGSHRLAIMIDD